MGVSISFGERDTACEGPARSTGVIPSRAMSLRTLCVALALTAACSGSDPVAPPDARAPADVAPDVSPDVSEPDVPAAVAALVRARPYQQRVPSSYDGSRAVPLVVLLHGYGANGSVQSAYLGLSQLYEQRGFLLALPDGTVDRNGSRFWNATNACCDFANTGVDDVAYVTAVIDDMSARYRVDPRRVYLIGHSNGGFMSHRMACDRAARVAAIVSLAGATWADPSRCAPSEPVAVLEVHGTVDDEVRYDGGTTLSDQDRYPSARDTVASWARLNRCGDFADTGMRFDYVTDVAGPETRVGAHAGCMGGAAELWTMEGVGHVPGFSPAWIAAVYDWLMAHPKPAR